VSSTSLSISLKPKVQDCASISFSSSCIAAPGCVFCPSYHTPRVLWDEDVSHTSRKAFNEILPDTISTSTSPEQMSGHCIDAVYATDCFTYSAASQRAMGCAAVTWGCSIAIVLLFLR
jgi:hypothetical protein